jgi:hypothetical protein
MWNPWPQGSLTTQYASSLQITQNTGSSTLLPANFTFLITINPLLKAANPIIKAASCAPPCSLNAQPAMP